MQPGAWRRPTKAKDVHRDDKDEGSETLQRNTNACPGHSDSPELSDLHKGKEN